MLILAVLKFSIFISVALATDEVSENIWKFFALKNMNTRWSSYAFQKNIMQNLILTLYICPKITWK